MMNNKLFMCILFLSCMVSHVKADDAYTGEIRMVAYDTDIPEGWLVCDGTPHGIADYPELYKVIGTNFGGYDSYFYLPDMSGRVPVCANNDNYKLGSTGGTETNTVSMDEMPAHSHAIALGLSPANKINLTTDAVVAVAHQGATPIKMYTTDDVASNQVALSDETIGFAGAWQPQAIDNMMPYQAVTYIICTKGKDPENDEALDGANLGEIRMFAGSCSEGASWHYCNGSKLAKKDYSALYPILSSWLPSDDNAYFSLPNLCGKTIVGAGSGNDLTAYSIGDTGGTETITLSSDQISHVHNIYVSSPAATKASPEKGNSLSIGMQRSAPVSMYSSSSSSDGKLNPNTISTVGTESPASMNNMMPFLSVNYIIILRGTYPNTAIE